MLGSIFFFDSLTKILKFIDSLPLFEEISFWFLAFDVLGKVFFNL